MEAEWAKTVAAFEVCRNPLSPPSSCRPHDADHDPLCFPQTEYPEEFSSEGVRSLARRLKGAAPALANELSPDPAWGGGRWTTVIHGDLKVPLLPPAPPLASLL